MVVRYKGLERISINFENINLQKNKFKLLTKFNSFFYIKVCKRNNKLKTSEVTYGTDSPLHL